MEERKIIAQINEANTNRYSDGKVVDKYLEERYHKKRIEISLKYLSENIEIQFPTLSPAEIKVIDIGCSSGMVSKMIHNLGFSVTASDYSTAQIDIQQNDSFLIQQFDANQIFPFPDNSFHSIFSGELIEHLFDTGHFLSECRRILKPNGILILTTPNLAGLEDRIKFLFGKPPRHINPLHPYLKLHIRQFTKSSLINALESFSFSNIKIKSNYLKIYLNEKRKIHSRLPAKLFPSIGGSLICVSIKN